MREWSLCVPAGVELISSNQRLHWAVKMCRVRELRRAGWALAKEAKIPPLTRVAITVIVHPGKRTNRLDPDNYHDTFKPLADGIVDAGVLPDDSAQYLVKVSYIVGTPWPKTGIELKVSAI